MQNLNLVVGNINVYNHHIIDSIFGIAGFSGSYTYQDDCTVTLNQSTDLCTEAEVLTMLGSLVLNGFSVKLV